MRMLQADSEPNKSLNPVEPDDDSTFGKASASGWSAALMSASSTHSNDGGSFAGCSTASSTSVASTTVAVARADPSLAAASKGGRKPNLVKSIRVNRSTGGGTAGASGNGINSSAGPTRTASVASEMTGPQPPPATTAKTTTTGADGSKKVVKKTSIKASELGIKLSADSTSEEIEEAVKKWNEDQKKKQQQTAAVTARRNSNGSKGSKPDPDGSRCHNRSISPSRGRFRGVGRGSGGPGTGTGTDGGRGGGRGGERVTPARTNSARSRSRGRAQSRGRRRPSPEIVDRLRSKSKEPNRTRGTDGVEVVNGMALTPRRPQSRGRPRLLHTVSDDSVLSPQQSGKGQPLKRTVIRRAQSGSEKSPNGALKKSGAVKKRIIVRRRSILGGSASPIKQQGETPNKVSASDMAVAVAQGSLPADAPLTSSPGNVGNTAKPAPAAAVPKAASYAAVVAGTAAKAKTEVKDPPELSPKPAVKKDPPELSPKPAVKKDPVPSWEYLNTPPSEAKKKISTANNGRATSVSPSRRKGSIKKTGSFNQKNVNNANPGVSTAISSSTVTLDPPMTSITSSGSTNGDNGNGSSRTARSSQEQVGAATAAPRVVGRRRGSGRSRSPPKTRMAVALAAKDHAEVQKRLQQAGVSRDQYLAMLQAGLDITLAA